MSEKDIEQALVRKAKSMGGIALKFVSPGFDGMPDRLVLFPGRCAAFVEVKAPGKKPRAIQVARHEMLRNMGFPVYVLNDKEKIGEMLDEIQSS
ncbi:MAG: VRR-NUC domain-containing protein [Oscillospiraceae bacterium]|nr:VRR-NUC domain-containing protein [Oscillospiraceae bacterium]